MENVQGPGEHLPKSSIVITFLRASSKGFPPLPAQKSPQGSAVCSGEALLEVMFPKNLDCLIPSWVQQGRQACVPVNSKSAPQFFSMGPTPQGFDASDKLQGRGSSSESFFATSFGSRAWCLRWPFFSFLIASLLAGDGSPGWPRWSLITPLALHT